MARVMARLVATERLLLRVPVNKSMSVEVNSREARTVCKYFIHH